MNSEQKKMPAAKSLAHQQEEDNSCELWSTMQVVVRHQHQHHLLHHEQGLHLLLH